MVFENLTLVELNLEDAQFSASTGRDEASGASGHSSAGSDGSGGGRRRLLLVLGLAVAIGATIAVRRYRGSDDGDGGIEIEESDVEVGAAVDR